MDHNTLGELNNVISTLNENVPQHIKQGFFKAVSRLGSAILEIPIAKLEGYSQDIRAANESRQKIIKTVGESVSGNIKTAEEYSDFAVSKYIKKILREQVNIDTITSIAATELNNIEDIERFNDPTVLSYEWLDEFEAISRTKTSNDMRAIFGKILAKEVCEPGKFSIRTLKIVSQLDKDIAEKFLTLCSISIATIIDGKIINIIAPSFNSGPLQHVDLSKFGIDHTDLTDLIDYGLVLPIDNLELVFSTCIADENGITNEYIWFDNKSLILKPYENYNRKKEPSTHGAFLTKAGIDLYSIVDFNYDNKTYDRLKDYFNKLDLELL